MPRAEPLQGTLDGQRADMGRRAIGISCPAAGQRDRARGAPGGGFKPPFYMKVHAGREECEAVRMGPYRPPLACGVTT